MEKIKVKLAQCSNRPIQLRYRCAATGKEVRLSTGTYDVADAERQRVKLEAELVLGIRHRKDDPTKIVGLRMPWEEYREQHYELHLKHLRASTRRDADSALDIMERILKPKMLGDVANAEALHRLQSKLLQGAESRFDPPRARSPHSVKSMMTAVLAALNWGKAQGWLDAVPTIRKVKTSKLRAAKGRPITTEEFERLLTKVPEVVGTEAAASWDFLLRGLWASALRLDELMHVSWDDPHYIMPVWRVGRLPVLQIPASMQKNDTEEEIPLLPWFARLLREIPNGERHGWVFKPKSLQIKLGRPVRSARAATDWIGKVIGQIGKAAKIVVAAGDVRSGKRPKYVSAHDLRRSCAERLVAERVPREIICRVLRHASWETTRKHYAIGDVQREAGVLRELLGTDSGTVQIQTEVRST